MFIESVPDHMYFEYNNDVKITVHCKAPGLVVNIEELQSELWSLDVGSNPGFTQKLDGKYGPQDDIIPTQNNRDSQMGQNVYNSLFRECSLLYKSKGKYHGTVNLLKNQFRYGCC